MSASVLVLSRKQSMQGNIFTDTVPSQRSSVEELLPLSTTELDILDNLQHVGSMLVQANLTLVTGSQTLVHLTPHKVSTAQDTKTLQLPASLVATRSPSSELIERPNPSHVTRCPSPLGPQQPFWSLDPNQSLPMPVHDTDRSLHKSVLLKAAKKVAAFQNSQYSTNHCHPQFATVLRSCKRANHRYAPYPQPSSKPKSYVTQLDNVAVAKKAQVPVTHSAHHKENSHLSALSNGQQNVIIHGFIKYVHPEAEQLLPPSPSHTSTNIFPLPIDPASFPEIQSFPSPLSTTPSAGDVSLTASATRLLDNMTNSETPDYVECSNGINPLQTPVVVTPEPIRVLPARQLEAASVDDSAAHEARKLEVLRSLFTPSPIPALDPDGDTSSPRDGLSSLPPLAEYLVRSPSPQTSDEGYKGSGPEDGVDELTDEPIDERYRTPAYRKALAAPPTTENELLQNDTPFSIEPPHPKSRAPPPPAPPRIFIPRAHRENRPVASGSSSNTLNWAKKERSLGPRPLLFRPRG
ncbi:hypothetical protein BDY19DRAFT_927134 [Irpex rosettiformis]|uniref:Uncharacterized protein n=1 Tax=Irpex rosettiformis TaxID=378272 RepID=A0ACB8UBT1_9APHY|nr:hypothetical protein BDY19DRAFT_927134 [Irpex rosettiformis]